MLGVRLVDGRENTANKQTPLCFVMFPEKIDTVAELKNEVVQTFLTCKLTVSLLLIDSLFVFCYGVQLIQPSLCVLCTRLFGVEAFIAIF